MHRLWNTHHAAWVSQRSATCAADFPYFLPSPPAPRFGKAVPALGKRTPGLDLHALFPHQRLVFRTLKKRMGLNLVHGGHNLIVHDEVRKAVGIEIAHADRADPSFPVKLLHCPPGTVIVAERLVDEVQVEKVKAEALEGP